MIKNILFSVILFIGSFQIAKATPKNDPPVQQTEKDSSRISELNSYWKQISKVVKDGDIEGYRATYHKDAVIIFATGNNKTSVSLSTALEGWKKGFQDTKDGKMKANVEFRFSQRIGNETTAHETGIFRYSSTDTSSKVSESYIIHFEMLLVKRNNKWFGVMEYQKSVATQKEWDALEK